MILTGPFQLVKRKNQTLGTQLAGLGWLTFLAPRRRAWACCRVLWTLLFLGLLSAAAQASEVYSSPTLEETRSKILDWATHRPDYGPEAEQAVQAIWSKTERLQTPPDRFDAVMQTYYLLDADVRQLVDRCSALSGPILLDELPSLGSSADSPFFTHNVRAFYARFLAVLRMYDEALEVYQTIDPNHLVDPATSLFYRAVCEHALLEREAGLKTITDLLENTQDVPARYASVAELMKHDLEALREKTLGEVSKQMRDSQRRLDLGRTGPRVQRVQDRVITTLDEIIEKLEQQQGGGGGGGNGQPRGNQSSNPANQSYVGGAKGPGEVDPKNIGHKSGWGNLPEKEQKAVRNMLDRQFPSHYRQAVEEYLKKLGQRTAPGK